MRSRGEEQSTHDFFTTINQQNSLVTGFRRGGDRRLGSESKGDMLVQKGI